MKLNEWDIDIDNLEGPDRKRWGFMTDEFYESPSGQFGCLIYSITEARMGWYLGRIALYTDKESPKVLVSPNTIHANGFNGHCSYSLDSRYIFISVSIRIEQQNNVYIPILMIDLERLKFSIIPLVNSFNYSITETGQNEFKLVENYRDDRFESFNNFIVNPVKFDWYNLNRIDDIRDLFNFNFWS